MTPSQAVAHAVSLMQSGKLGQAEDACRQILKARPDLAEAHNVLGVVLHRQGRLEQGIGAVCAAIRLDGSSSNFHSNLGEMLRQAGRTDRAITVLWRAIRLDPCSAQAYNNLGIAYFDKHEFEDAVQMYRKAILLFPRYAEAHANCGNALCLLDRHQEAIESYRVALSIQPQHFAAHKGLATALWNSERLAEAEQSFERAISLNPAETDLYCRLSYLLTQQGRTGEAISLLNEALRVGCQKPGILIALGRTHLKRNDFELAKVVADKALELNPDHPEALCLQGQVLYELDRLEEAIGTYRKALALRPNFAECRTHLAIALKAVGELEQAENELEHLLDRQPDVIGAYTALADLKRFTRDDPHLQAMEKIVGRTRGVQDQQRLFLHYALGKAYDDIGDYDKAFAHFTAGAKVRRAQLHSKNVRREELFNRVAAVFDKAFFATAPIVPGSATVPIFIVGMPRSGSTLIEQILASHPQVAAMGEAKTFDLAMRALRGAFPDLPPFPDSVKEMENEHYAYFAREYFCLIDRKQANSPIVVDKLLSNFANIGFIWKAFPNAKVVHAFRDPMDTCFSCYTKLFRDNVGYADLREIAGHYKQYRTLMAHWDAVLPQGFKHNVAYEDLVRAFEPRVRALVRFCGLEWDDRCLSFHEKKRPNKSASAAQVRRPLYTSALGRWRRYSKHLTPLIEEIGPMVQTQPRLAR